MMRKLIDVITEIKSHIPEWQPELLNKFKKIEESLAFSAPENEKIWWDEVSGIIHSIAYGITPRNSDSAGWKLKIIAIYSEKTVDEVREVIMSQTPLPNVEKVKTMTPEERITAAIAFIPTDKASLVYDLNLLKTTANTLSNDSFLEEVETKIISVHLDTDTSYQKWETNVIETLTGVPAEFFIKKTITQDTENQIASFKGKSMKERGLCNTICDIRSLVPETEIELQKELSHYLEIVSKIPDSHKAFWWEETAKLFNDVIPLVTTEDWHFKVLSIINQMTVKDCRIAFGVQESIDSAVDNNRIFTAKLLANFIRGSTDYEDGEGIWNYIQAALQIKYGNSDNMSPVFGFRWLDEGLRDSGYLHLWMIDFGEINDIQHHLRITLALDETMTKFKHAEAINRVKGSPFIGEQALVDAVKKLHSLL